VGNGSMRTQTIVGTLLVVIGIAIIVFRGFSYTTTHEAAKVGPLNITTQERRTVIVPRVFGGLLVVSGVALLVAGARRPASAG
jgi:uncharacterized membrane protein SirB2